MDSGAPLGVGFGVVAAGATVLTVYRPRIRSWREQRHERREQQRALDELQQSGALLKLKVLVEGSPAVLDAAGNEQMPATPSLQVMLHRLDQRTVQLTTNSGSHLADKVIATAESLTELHVKFDDLQTRTNARHEEYVRRLDALDTSTTANGAALEDARQLAVEAASIAKRTTDGYIRLEDVLRELWRLIVERVEHAETRIATYMAVLQELGIDVELPDPPPHD